MDVKAAIRAGDAATLRRLAQFNPLDRAMEDMGTSGLTSGPPDELRDIPPSSYRADHSGAVHMFIYDVAGTSLEMLFWYKTGEGTTSPIWPCLHLVKIYRHLVTHAAGQRSNYN